MKHNIYEAIAAVNEIVSPAYLSGGAVRAHVGGGSSPDLDFCTPLLPEEVEELVKAAGRHVNPIGKLHGTIMFKAPMGDEFVPVEVTTFRTEAYEKDSRKPVVAFVDNLHHDLSRRDFTVNAMAIGPNGRLIDLFGGEADLADHIIRAVGKPKERFNEDPLRMLRMCRFATQLESVVDPETMAAAQDRAHRILMVSKERWVQEMDKILISPRAHFGLHLIEKSGLLRFMFPELQVQVGYDQMTPYHAFTLWEHTMRMVEGLPEDIDMRWAGLLHDIAKPAMRVKNRKGRTFTRVDEYGVRCEVDQHHFVKHDLVGAEMAGKVCDYLRFSKDRKTKVVDYVLGHMNASSPMKASDHAAAVDWSFYGENW